MHNVLEKSEDYKAGYEAGREVQTDEAESFAEAEGYDKGYDEALREVPFVSWEDFYATLVRASLPILEGACLRWDAAERCLVVWTLDGREVRFR